MTTRTVAVTGAASGIGAATAGILAARGDRVIGVDLRGTDVIADLSTSEGRRDAVAAIGDACGGRLDGLVTCAGLSQAGPAQVSVNFFGTTDLVLGLQPVLAAAEAPRVALVGSIAATQGHDDTLVQACLAGDEEAGLTRAAELAGSHRGHEIYSSTKAALHAWLRQVSVTDGFAGAGIPVNAIAPGVVLTPMTANLISDPQWKQIMDAAVPMPLNGYAEPETIANALIWLLSPENTHMAGQAIFVDGGAEVLTVG